MQNQLIKTQDVLKRKVKHLPEEISEKLLHTWYMSNLGAAMGKKTVYVGECDPAGNILSKKTSEYVNPRNIMLRQYGLFK